jgi:hypothetical protein
MPTSDWERGYAAGYHAAHRSDVRDITVDRGEAAPPKRSRKKRGPSAYNKRYAAAYKKLKKKHPRSSFAALAKKAHKEARKK